MNSTTFKSAMDIVTTPARTVDALRGPDREDRIGECRISNRSNYTRVTFDGNPAAAFLIPAGPYAARMWVRPDAMFGTFHFLGGPGETVMTCLTPTEMRAMAYGLLAAANWADSRDSGDSQSQRRPARPYATQA